MLEHELADTGSVLEIGSGTAEHAVIAAAALPHLDWQPSDLSEQLPGIRLQISASGIGNVLEPIVLDVMQPPEERQFDAVFTANTLHIVDEKGVEGLIFHAAMALSPGGRFYCYGPFKRGGEFSTPSNARFDASLKAHGIGMGIRDLEAVDTLCERAGLVRRCSYAMPANNLLLAWEKQDDW